MILYYVYQVQFSPLQIDVSNALYIHKRLSWSYALLLGERNVVVVGATGRYETFFFCFWRIIIMYCIIQWHNFFNRLLRATTEVISLANRPVANCRRAGDSVCFTHLLADLKPHVDNIVRRNIHALRAWNSYENPLRHCVLKYHVKVPKNDIWTVHFSHPYYTKKTIKISSWLYCQCRRQRVLNRLYVCITQRCTEDLIE